MPSTHFHAHLIHFFIYWEFEWMEITEVGKSNQNKTKGKKRKFRMERNPRRGKKMMMMMRESTRDSAKALTQHNHMIVILLALALLLLVRWRDARQSTSSSSSSSSHVHGWMAAKQSQHFSLSLSGWTKTMMSWWCWCIESRLIAHHITRPRIRRGEASFELRWRKTLLQSRPRSRTFRVWVGESQVCLELRVWVGSHKFHRHKEVSMLVLYSRNNDYSGHKMVISHLLSNSSIVFAQSSSTRLPSNACLVLLSNLRTYSTLTACERQLPSAVAEFPV